jgi:hypothetical protein
MNLRHLAAHLLTLMRGVFLLSLLCLGAPAGAAYTLNVSTAPSPLTGLWWNPNEPGWGLGLVQQGPVTFVSWYTYSQSGAPFWYVMSNCAITGTSCSGDIYSVSGGSAPGTTWNPAGKTVTKVGSGTLSFSDNNTGVFSYSVDGVSGVKNISRQMFGSGSTPPVTDFSGLWWNPAESGWGVALAQQSGTIFAAWFTYDATGKATWYVASNCALTATGKGCSGDLYQVAGGTPPTTTWNGSGRVATKVGTISFTFTGSGPNSVGTMKYMLNGVGGTKTLARQVFYNFQPNGGGNTAFNMEQTVSDEAQRTTIAFSGLAMMTGNLGAQSFYPPGKVADYTGFQYLRDNDPDNMGHNTSFLTRVANNVLYILDDTQLAKLKALASVQLEQASLYGYKRYPLMKAFRRQLDSDLPSGSTGLNLNAVKKASRELYLIDGQISFDRAMLYVDIFNTLSTTQKATLDAMKGKGWNSWPDIKGEQIRSKMASLPQGTAVAVMTYASDLYSWYAGSVEADVYFCPERHGTYYGGFFIKDAPAVGHEGYSISEQLTNTAGSALSDSALGYVTQSQATLMSSLVETQRNNLYASTSSSIVKMRTDIATLLRGLRASTTNSTAVNAQVLALSATYGELDGANNHAYASVFAQIYKTLSSEQKTKLAALRKSIMSGTYADGTPFDFSASSTNYLYSDEIKDASLLTPYIGNTDALFFEP